MDYAKLICRFDDSELDSHVEDFLDIIKTEFSGDRQEKLLELYNTEPYKTQLREAPASSIGFFHNAYIGGYCTHIQNVIRNCRAQYSFYKNVGGTIDFELEELIFAAMHHDLGKLGDETGAQYLLNENDWEISKRNMFFKTNPDIQHMDPSTRGYYILSQFEVKYTWKEMLGIRLADGLYEEGNKEFLTGFGEAKQLKTNLPAILHVSDFFAAKLESDEYKRLTQGNSAELDNVME